METRYDLKQKQETAKLLNYLNEPFSYPSKQDIRNIYLQSGIKEAGYTLYNTAINHNIDILVIDFEKLVLDIYHGNCRSNQITREICIHYLQH